MHISLFIILIICAGCSISKGDLKERGAEVVSIPVSEAEAKVIAQNTLLAAPEDVYKKVYFNQPQIQYIDWNHPENKWMKNNIRGYYQKFQDFWAVRFSPKYDKSTNNQIGCQVWVNKKSGKATLSCARFDL